MAGWLLGFAAPWTAVLMTGAVTHTQDIVLNLLGYRYNGIPRTAAGTLCTDSSSYSIACPVPLPISLLVRLVISEVS